MTNLFLRAVARVGTLGLVARFTIIGAAAVGFLVAGGIGRLVDVRLTEFMFGHVAARAMDQVELGVLHAVSPADFEPPYSTERLADIAARLDPVLAKVRQDGSGVIRLHVFVADGTVIYSDLVNKRGTVTSPEKAGLASALQDRSRRGSPSSPLPRAKS